MLGEAFCRGEFGNWQTADNAFGQIEGVLLVYDVVREKHWLDAGSRCIHSRSVLLAKSLPVAGAIAGSPVSPRQPPLVWQAPGGERLGESGSHEGACLCVRLADVSPKL